jgi:hypothetical protein
MKLTYYLHVVSQIFQMYLYSFDKLLTTIALGFRQDFQISWSFFWQCLLPTPDVPIYHVLPFGNILKKKKTHLNEEILTL